MGGNYPPALGGVGALNVAREMNENPPRTSDDRGGVEGQSVAAAATAAAALRHRAIGSRLDAVTEQREQTCKQAEHICLQSTASDEAESMNSITVTIGTPGSASFEKEAEQINESRRSRVGCPGAMTGGR